MSESCNFMVVICPDCGKRRTERCASLYSLCRGFRGYNERCDKCEKKKSHNPSRRGQ